MFKSSKAEEKLLPHLDAAYNLARWLLRNPQDAEDALQDSFLRALRFFDQLKGEEAKPWLLKIVRNTCYDRLQKNSAPGRADEFDEDVHSSEETEPNPETLLLLNADISRVRNALEALDVQYREALVLRELEGQSYEEISRLLDVPIGTVMSRISRARTKIKKLLENEKAGDK